MLEKIKKRLNILNNSRDVEIQSYIDEFIDKIKSICNRNDLPDELEYMAIKYAMNCTVFYKNGYGEGKQVIASMSDIGQSISYKDVGAIAADEVDLDKYISKNKDEISMYAYVRW